MAEFLLSVPIHSAEPGAYDLVKGDMVLTELKEAL